MSLTPLRQRPATAIRRPGELIVPGRRRAGLAPDEVEGVALWLDGQAAAAMSQTWNGPVGNVGDGDPVGRVDVKASVPGDGERTAAVDPWRPTYWASVGKLGGNPGLLMATSNTDARQLEGAARAASDWWGTDSCHIFWAGIMDDPAVPGPSWQQFLTWDSSQADGRIYVGSLGAVSFTHGAGQVVSPNGVANPYYGAPGVWEFIRDGADGIVRVNGADIFTASTFTTAIGATARGVRAGKAADSSPNGWLAHLVHYTARLSEGDAAGVRRWLARSIGA